LKKDVKMAADDELGMISEEKESIDDLSVKVARDMRHPAFVEVKVKEWNTFNIQKEIESINFMEPSKDISKTELNEIY
jgi:hypothetical protein